MEKHAEVLCGVERPNNEIVSEALEYIEEFYRENNLPDNEKDGRIAEVVADIRRQGYVIKSRAMPFIKLTPGSGSTPTLMLSCRSV